MGYESAAVTQKGYNGVAVSSLTPIETISTALAGDGDPVGTQKFAYKLAWMERLGKEMSAWIKKDAPMLIGGDFNVILEDIGCHKLASWIHDALFQPAPRAKYRGFLNLGYIDAFRSLHPGKPGSSPSGTTSAWLLSTIEASASTISCCRRNWPLA